MLRNMTEPNQDKHKKHDFAKRRHPPRHKDYVKNNACLQVAKKVSSPDTHTSTFPWQPQATGSKPRSAAIYGTTEELLDTVNVKSLAVARNETLAASHGMFSAPIMPPTSPPNSTTLKYRRHHCPLLELSAVAMPGGTTTNKYVGTP